MKLPRALQDIRTIKTLLTDAETESKQAGDDLPGPEHLLLAALKLPDGTARQAFERAGTDPAGFRAAVETVHRQALEGIGVVGAVDDVPPAAPPRGLYRLTGPGQQAFQAAVDLAKSGSGSGSGKPVPLRGAHVVAAVCGQERGTAARALHALGVDRAALSAAALAVLAAG